MIRLQDDVLALLVERIGWVLVHSLWQFCVIALLAMGLQRGLQRTSAAVRYFVLLGILSLLIVAPLGTWMILPNDPQDSSVSNVVPHDLQPSWNNSQSAMLATPNAAIPATEEQQAGDAPAGDVAAGDPPARSIPAGDLPAAALHFRSNTPVVPSWWSVLHSAVRPWLSIVVGVWSAGVLVFAVRPILGWYSVRYLRTVGVSSVPHSVLEMLCRCTSKLHVRRSVEVLQSALVRAPIVVGYFRPVILLPASVLTGLPAAHLEAILAHELAHICRHDFLVNLLQTLIETVFFYHPAVWWLSRQIRDERESCCDDMAVAATGDRVEYGRALLAIAELRNVPNALALGIRGGSLLARIRRLLHTDEARRSHAGSEVVAGTLTLAVMGALVVFAHSAADADDLAKGEVTVTGMVLKPDGQPAPGARVYAMAVTKQEYGGNATVLLLEETVAAADGTFSLEYTDPNNSDQRGVNQFERHRRNVQFVATLEGYAFALTSLRSAKRHRPRQELLNPSGSQSRFLASEWEPANDSIRLQLGRNEALSGRIVDWEGRPMQGVQIEVGAIEQFDERLNAWYKRMAKRQTPSKKQGMAGKMKLRPPASRSPPPRLAPQRLPPRLPPAQVAVFAGTGVIPIVQTDSDGRFSIPEIGQHRIVALRVTGPTIARTTFKMLNLRGPDVFDPFPDPQIRDRMIHGAGATLAVEPAVAVTGFVTDAQSRRPIAGCKVDVTQVAGTLATVKDFASTTADASGHYMLGQLPPDPPHSRGFRIRFTPPAGAPFFPTDLRVRVKSHETTFDVGLLRARVIKGRVIDEKTGQPVRALVAYLPTLDNKSAADYPNFDARIRSIDYSDFRLNDPDSSFRVPAINGRGVLCVTAERMAAYALAGHADRIEGLQREGDEFGLYHLSGASMVNEFREVNLSEADADPTIDIALRPLSRRPVRLVDTNGKSVVGCRATGLMPDLALAERGDELLNDPPLRSAEVEVVGLEFESPRGLAFHYPERNIAAVVVTRDKDFPRNEALTVTLQSCGQIRGRLLDASHKPVQGRAVRAMGLLDVELPKTPYQVRPATFIVYTATVQTNSDGWFQIANVIPGIRYRVTAEAGPPNDWLAGRSIVPPAPPTTDTVVVEPGKTLDVGDLQVAGEGPSLGFGPRAIRDVRFVPDDKREIVRLADQFGRP